MSSFDTITTLSMDGHWSSHKAFLTMLRTHKMDSACDNVMSGSHVWKVYYYRYSDNLYYTNCAWKPLENFQCIFEGESIQECMRLAAECITSRYSKLP